MSRTVWRDRTFDVRTAKMLGEVAKHVGPLIVPTQGSYSNSAASVGTHSGGGAVDLSVRGLSTAEINEIVREMRKVGFAAWHRSSSEGPWAPHIHAIAVGAPDLAPVAARQVASLRRGRNGLVNNAPDRHAWMNMPVVTWEHYLAGRDHTPAPAVPAFPGVAVFRLGHSDPAITAVGKRLKAKGFDRHNDGDGYQPGPTYTRYDLANISDWQRSIGDTGSNADGRLGPKQWKRLFA